MEIGALSMGATCLHPSGHADVRSLWALLTCHACLPHSHRISTLKRHLDGSTELLRNLAGNIQTLRSRMTPEELEAQHALTVAEKRVERLQRVAETVQKGVSGWLFMAYCWKGARQSASLHSLSREARS